MPYAIIKLSDESIFRRFAALPKNLQIGTRRIVAPVNVGDEGTIQGETYRMVEIVEIGFDRPGPYFDRSIDTPVLTGNTLTITRTWNAWDQPTIDAYEATQLEAKAGRFDQVGSDTRALAIIMMSEINNLRTNAGLSPRTSNQFRTAFKNALEQ
tara:strand:- start:38145 stop:38606 length:462 start_codon:yes stop_codon:yes gene_type:complete